jgi:hypothetical protein
MNTEGTGWLLHLQRTKQIRIPLKSFHYSLQGKKQLGDRRNDGENNCNSGDRTGQMAQPWMFIMMKIIASKFNLVEDKYCI